jgi:hypothetical protein
MFLFVIILYICNILLSGTNEFYRPKKRNSIQDESYINDTSSEDNDNETTLNTTSNTVDTGYADTSYLEVYNVFINTIYTVVV